MCYVILFLAALRILCLCLIWQSLSIICLGVGMAELNLSGLPGLRLLCLSLDLEKFSSIFSEYASYRFGVLKSLLNSNNLNICSLHIVPRFLCAFCYPLDSFPPLSLLQFCIFEQFVFEGNC